MCRCTSRVNQSCQIWMVESLRFCIIRKAHCSTLCFAHGIFGGCLLGMFNWHIDCLSILISWNCIHVMLVLLLSTISAIWFHGTSKLTVRLSVSHTSFLEGICWACLIGILMGWVFWCHRIGVHVKLALLLSSGNYACMYMSDKNAFICHQVLKRHIYMSNNF